MITLLKSLFALFVYQVWVYAGVINPDNANPIQMERTNESATSSYTFYMSLSTRLPANTGVIKITFPISTFDDPSRNPALSLSDYGQFTFIKTRFNQVTLFQKNLFQTTDGTLTSNYLSAKWNDIGRYLEIYNISDSINAGSVQITIKFIRNPVSCANRASGNFQIQTFIDSTKVDENLSFGKVTFSDPYIQSNQNIISNDGSNLGGFITNYKITFSTTVTLPANTWFRVRFPSAYTFGQTSCALITDTTQQLTCDDNGDNVLIFSGIQNELVPNTYTIQIKNINNPTATGFFNQFVLECLYPGTSNVLQLFYNSMNGITINPGQIKSVSIAGNPLNMNLRIDYTILFTPTNTIPYPGKIEIQFPELSATVSDPNIRKFTLDSTCRVISGLTPIAGLENVSCVSSGSSLIISDFQTFYSQQIQVKVYAVNPGRAAQYTPFVIKTSLYDATALQYYVIDQNDAAGSISISEVNSLNYVQIDFFKLMANGTFNQNIPLDFRLYPSPTKELPLSNSVTQHEISLQIPLLWRNKNADWTHYYQQGDKPGVLFGNEPAYDDVPALRPKYNLHVYQFKTPKETNYAKFPSGYGLAQCDLPISIDWVRMPPFGGKYVFRVLTFLSGTHYTDVPLEQDLYQMDIPIPNFNSATVTTSGTESGDVDNVIIATLVTGIQIPYEGAINFNMTTTTIFSENTSKWDTQLGQSMTVSQGSINVPCSIYINGDLSGFSNSNHPNARCYVFKGTQIQNVILQVRGFSSPIGSSSTVQVYVPNIRLCEDVQKQCYISINSAYTADLSDPYILNTIYVKVVNSINTASTVTPALNTIIPASPPTFATVAPETKEICLFATWNLGSAFYTTPFSAGDYIIIIFPSYRFTYRKAAVMGITYTFGGASGSVTYIDFYTTKETYYLLRVSAAVPVGTNLFLNSIKNANDVIDFGPNNSISIDQGVILKAKYWQVGKKVSYVEWPRASQYLDGGILFTNISILPNIAPAPIRAVATDMEWEAEIVYKVDFTNCRVVPQGGQFNIRIPNAVPYFKAVNSQCNVQQGLTGISQVTLQSSIVCSIVNDGTYNIIQISQFQQVAQETNISIIFRATNPVQQGAAWNPGNYYITSNDETGSHVNCYSSIFAQQLFKMFIKIFF